MSKTYFIEDQSVRNLNDKSLSVRQNALKSITEIIKNNISFNSKEQNMTEINIVNLPLLVRCLISMFKYEDNDLAAVLDLLNLLFIRYDFIRIITSEIKLERIKIEIDKIRTIFGEIFETQLDELRQSLKNYEVYITRNFLSSEDLTTFDSPTMEVLLSPSIQPDEGKVFWNPLEGVNLDYFNYLSSQLNVQNLSKIMPYLQDSIKNFPAEYFVAKPIIIDRIIRVLENLQIEKYPEVIRVLNQLVVSMKKRWIESKIYGEHGSQFESAIENIISVVSQCIDHYSHNTICVIEQCELLNELFYLSLSLASYTMKVGNIDLKKLKSLLESLASLSKFSRQAVFKDKKNAVFYRVTHINCLLVINAFQGSITQDVSENPTCLDMELDTALLNASLQLSHPKLYNLILKNRTKVIDADENLRIFLICRDYFKPLVKVLQNHLEMNVEEIICEGEIALHTIRIHQSQQLVDLLLKSINKFCKTYSLNADTLKSAQTIYLRLLCIEILEIKLQAYQNLKNQICKFAQSGGANFNGNLINAIGIPLTPEIVAEVFCYGAFNTHDKIKENSIFSLSTLFRMQVICPQALPKVIKIIEPILPLSPCLFAIKENNIGLFAFEVLQDNSSFEKEELNFAIARFLYSTNMKIQEVSKKNLLKRLGYSNDMVEIVPSNFCIVKDSLVRTINIPSDTAFDEDGYETLAHLLKTMDRSSDSLQNLLIQMNVLMDSAKFCQRSHDDHLWVYFVGELGKYHLHHNIIRQLSISILMKWSLINQEFRLFLSREMNVLKFVIDTLITFQGDDQTKTKASTFLFLLVFTEFIVTSEKTLSMPEIMKNVKCPFKYETHWTISPYNSISVLEENIEAMQENTSDDGKKDILEVCMRFLRTNFHCLWNKWDSDGSINLEHEDALPIPEKMLLTREDNNELLQMKTPIIFKYFGNELDNVASYEGKMAILHQLESSLIMFADEEINNVEIIEKRLARCWNYRHNSEEHVKLLKQSMKVFRIIMKSLSDEKIVEFAQNEFFLKVLTSSEKYDEKTFTEVMKTFEIFVKLCVENEKITKSLPKNYIENFSSNVTNQIFKNVMKHDEWSEVKKIAQVKPLLRIYHELLSLIQQTPDSILQSFEKFLDSVPKIFKVHLDHIRNSSRIYIHSDLVRHIFEILLKLSTIIGTQDVNFTKWNENIFKRLQFWSNGESRTFKHYPWLVFAALTYKKTNFISFNSNFNEAVKVPFIQSSVDALLTTAETYPLLEKDQNAIVSVLRNIFNHSAESIKSSSTTKIIDRLITFKNSTALYTMIKTLVLNDIGCFEQIMKSRNLIKYLMDFQSIDHVDEAKLNDLANRFETLAICYKYKPLQEHVADVLTHQVSCHYILLLNDCNKPRNAIHKRFDIMTIDLILILIQSDTGIMKLSNMFKVPNIIDRFLKLSHEIIIDSQKPKQIKLILEFWCRVFDASVNFSSTAIDSIGLHCLDVKKHKTIINNSNDPHREFIGNNLKKINFAIELLFLQVVSIFNSIIPKCQKEANQDIDSACYELIQKLTSRFESVKQLAKEVKLIEIINEKLSSSLYVMSKFRHTEISKSKGVTKAQIMIRDVCLFNKCLIDCDLPLAENSSIVKQNFLQFLEISDWLEADGNLMNSFFDLLLTISRMDIGRTCCIKQYEGKPLMKAICMRTEAISFKAPHTPTALDLISNGIKVLIAFSKFIDVRQILKSINVLRKLENLQIHLEGNKKSNWDFIIIKWLELVQFLSKFDDFECSSNDMSLLCRIVRNGNQEIKSICLSTIKRLSSNKSAGLVLINSEHFKQVSDDLLNSDSENLNEKTYILQSLLSISLQSDAHRAKIKNSSWNRKLKEHLNEIQIQSRNSNNVEVNTLSKLAKALDSVLYIQ